MTTEKKMGSILGELESEIMDIVWKSENPILVKDVALRLSKKRKLAYTTVMTIMGRLVEKGLLKRTPSGKAYAYVAVYSKDKFLARISRQIIRNFISSFGEAAVAHFAEEVDKLTPQKRKQLQMILKDSQKKK